MGGFFIEVNIAQRLRNSCVAAFARIAARAGAIYMTDRIANQTTNLMKNRFILVLKYLIGWPFSVLALIYALVGRDRIQGKRPGLPELGPGADPRLTLTSYNQGGGPSLRGGVGWINSGPITYRVGTRQYVSIVSGLSMFVFALDE